MSNESPSLCPRCGASLAGSSVDGLCARCLGALNFATGTFMSGEPRPGPVPALTPEELAPHFPQLDILDCLGRGGMGVVYKARQKSLNRLVALKLLAPERANDPGFAERFEKEAQALAALNHPHIIGVYDFGQAGGFYYLLMEFVDGVNLRQAMKAGRFTPEQALAVVPPVCEALQYAHEHGIVHRDIKPENLLLDKEGRVKIADFGIAKLLHADDSDAGLAESQPAGTPQYMAPEQKEHRRTDHRADIYSLGVVLYELLTGELPADKLQPPSRKVQIDVRLDEIVLRALEVKPELRYQTAGEMRTQVETVVATPMGRRREEDPTSSVPSRFLKVGTSTLTTRERLATCGGQFYLYRTRGQLILDDRQLTHSRDGTNTVIPLAAIRDLNVCRYPRTLAPAGIDLLSVTYEEGGQRKQVLLSPMTGWFGFPSTFNAHVAEWFNAIRDAVTAATGREPPSTPRETLSFPGASRSIFVFYLALLAPAVAAFVFIAIKRQTPGASGSFPFNVNLIYVVLALAGLAVALTAIFRFGVRVFGAGIPAVLASGDKDSPLAPGTATPQSGGLRGLAIPGLLALVVLGVTVAMWFLFARPAPVVTPSFTPVRLEKNVVTLDLKAVILRGPVEVQVTLEGPELPADKTAQVLNSNYISEDAEVITPAHDEGDRGVRTLRLSTTTWRAAFVLPNESLAKAVWENLQPLGPLEIHPDRSTAGTLFEVTTPQGEAYTGKFIVLPARSRLGGEASAPEAMSDRKAATPHPAPKIPAIVSGRLLDQDGKSLGGKILTFVKEDSVVITDGPTSDDGTFQFELPVDLAWQAVLLVDGKPGPRSETMATPTPGSRTIDVPNYELELRLEGTRLNARLTQLSPEAMPRSETDTSAKPQRSTLPDSAYIRTGLPVTAMKWPTPPSWGEAKDGLQAGLRINGGARIGGEVKVELWLLNSGTQDVKIRTCGRADVGLQVMAKDGTGMDHHADFTPFDILPLFQPIQLPPGHLLKVKEFILRFDSAANTWPPALMASLHLPPGDYNLRVKWSDSHPIEITSGEVGFKLMAQEQ